MLAPSVEASAEAADWFGIKMMGRLSSINYPTPPTAQIDSPFYPIPWKRQILTDLGGVA